MAATPAPRVAHEANGDDRLLTVLLADALQTVAIGTRAPGLHEARRWICARGSEHAYSFERACHVLGLPANALRRRIGLRPQAARRSGARGGLRGSNL